MYKEETKLRNITLIDMNQNTVDILRRRIADAAKVVNMLIKRKSLK